ncbi:ATP-binding protein [Castellaniella ginsengisoli]|uniref:histidine kinase n=1 Tax=Castellaniella ginsengisoli TaxID=546114 RepID=A0AB39E0A6_9BURK
MSSLDKHIPIGLVVLDQSRIIRHMNAHMAALTEISAEKIIGKKFEAVFAMDRAGRRVRPAGSQPFCSDEGAGQGESSDAIGLNITTQGGRAKRLDSLLCFPFADSDGHNYHAMLFHEPDTAESGGSHPGFSGAIKDIHDARNEQRRLLMEIERANENLIQSEKLAGIGQLAAGVAHEINNPAGYVFSNLRTLASYVTDLLKIIDAVDESQTLEDIKRLKNTLDYTDIRDDVEALIRESGEGIDRIKKIISALQDFCHIDAEEFSLHDLHACLDTTLSVASSEIKYKATVVKEYADLPRIECNASQINQVILNLVVNAAQAIDQEGIITIRTGQEKSDVWFEVQDTGKGIPPELLTRVFEPFFTTKPVGQGTGLGLALSYKIVQKHHGRLEVFSEPGQGTRIRAWFPIAQPHLFESSE